MLYSCGNQVLTEPVELVACDAVRGIQLCLCGKFIPPNCKVVFNVVSIGECVHLMQFNLCIRKQSTQPALASIMRNRRVQFLPIQWRANLKLTLDEEREREHEGLDNKFSLAGLSWVFISYAPYILV